MNERIKQLAVEAGMIVGEPNGFDMTRLMPKEVKFAQLIVTECLDVINQSNGVGDDDVIKISKDVEKHFGVEA